MAIHIRSKKTFRFKKKTLMSFGKLHRWLFFNRWSHSCTNAIANGILLNDGEIDFVHFWNISFVRATKAKRFDLPLLMQRVVGSNTRSHVFEFFGFHVRNLP